MAPQGFGSLLSDLQDASCPCRTLWLRVLRFKCLLYLESVILDGFSCGAGS